MARVLIIDDDELFCEALSQAVEHLGHEPSVEHRAVAGLARARRESFAVVMLDVRLPDRSGIEILPELRLAPSRPEVIIITGNGDPDGAELAIRSGAWDYVEKPASISRMTLPLARALEYRVSREATQPRVLSRKGLVGESPAFLACLEQLAEAAASEASVLITGETGTGKEVLARAVHANSRVAEESFVVVDCAALPETLVESVLFGHAKGSFTGAGRDHDGLIRLAHRGTLFLDEIGELPLSEQKSFLRVLQERRFRPVGGCREVESHFRLVVATNRDLEAMVQEGLFRQDLLFRIKGTVIRLPPLRERAGDIRLLAQHYATELCARMDVPIKELSPEFLEALERYDWPGNVRELVHTMQKAMVSARRDSTLYAAHLPQDMRVKVLRNAMARERLEPVAETATETGEAWKEFKVRVLDSAEREFFTALYVRTGGNVREMARLSKLTQARVYGILKKHRIGS